MAFYDSVAKSILNSTLVLYCSMYSRCYATKARSAAVSGQRLGKHVPAKQTTEQRLLLGSGFLIMEQLDYNNGRAVFST
jgi:hypothetical protein